MENTPFPLAFGVIVPHFVALDIAISKATKCGMMIPNVEGGREFSMFGIILSQYWMGITNRPTPVSSLIQQRRLKLFGHIARAAASEDHSRAL